MGIYVGLDCSLTGSGFTKITDEQVEVKLIKTKPADFDHDLDRIKHIAKELSSRIPDNTDLVCIEDFFVPHSAAQMGSAIELVKLGTCIRLELYGRKIPFTTIAPTSLKKFGTGKGTGDKSIIVKEVFKRWGIDCTDNNIADSVVLAKIAEAVVAWKAGARGLPSYQKEVVEKTLNDRPKYNFTA